MLSRSTLHKNDSSIFKIKEPVMKSPFTRRSRSVLQNQASVQFLKDQSLKTLESELLLDPKQRISKLNQEDASKGRN